MTANQVAYLRYQEEKRANQAREEETIRHNLLTENVAEREAQTKLEEARTHRYTARNQAWSNFTQNFGKLVTSYTDSLSSAANSFLKLLV